MVTTAPPTRSLEQYVPRIATEWELESAIGALLAVEARVIFEVTSQTALRTVDGECRIGASFH